MEKINPAAETQGLQGADRGQDVCSAPTVFLGNRQSLDAKRGAPFPPIPRKFLLQVARDQILVQLLARKLDDRLLQS
jgi:hypothetical protein